MSYDLQKLIATLRQAEGVKRYVYDDASGVNLGPGAVLKGWPTVGVGRNLAGVEMSDGAINFLLSEDIATANLQAANMYGSVFSSWDDARQRAVIEMIFNLGMTKYRQFLTMSHDIIDNDWAGAAVSALDSLWARQVGDRSKRIAYQLQYGKDPEGSPASLIT